MNERYELDPRGDVMDNLRSEYRVLKTEFAHQSKTAKARTIKASVLWCAFGAALGMTGMVYWYEHQPKPQPVVVHSEMSYATPALDAAMDKLKTSLEVHFIQQEAALRKMQQDTVKLSTINKAMAAQLIERAPVKRVEQGHERSSGDHPASNPTTHDAAPLSIQHMATELGVSKMVVK